MADPTLVCSFLLCPFCQNLNCNFGEPCQGHPQLLNQQLVLTGEDGHGMVKGSPSPMKRLRRLRHVQHLKREIEDERVTDLLECHDFENIVHDTRKLKRLGRVVDPGFDWENITPQELSPTYGLEENYPNYDHLRLNNSDGNGSSLVRRVGKVEKILSVKDRLSGPDAIFRVKESHKSYRQVVSVQGSVLRKQCPQLLRIFLKRMAHLGRNDGHTLDDKDSPDFDPMYTRIDRIIAAEQRGCKKCYLVKWCGLPYAEVTWEKEENLQRDVAAICRFHKNTLRISSIRRNEALLQVSFWITHNLIVLSPPFIVNIVPKEHHLAAECDELISDRRTPKLWPDILTGSI